MEKPGRPDKKTFFAQWLETLQQESWQLELLISGFALFGVWEARGLVEQFHQQLMGANSFQGISGQALALIMLIVRSGLLIVLVNFLIHVSLRALWIGAIGLRYVSGDIDYDKLDYSSRFRTFFTSSFGSFDDYIEKLENWCSVIFAYTFLLVGIFTSFMLYVMWFVLAVGFIQSTFSLPVAIPLISILTFAYIGLGCIVFFDFISMGLLRKVEERYISLFYLRLYQIFGILTLSFVYRPLLLNFFDTKFTKRLFLLSLPYIAFILLVFPPMEVVSNGYYPQITNEFGLSPFNYDDLREARLKESLQEKPERRRIRYFSLEQHIIDKPYSKIFFNSHEDDNQYFEHMVGIQASKKTGLRHDIFAKGEIADTTDQTRIVALEEEIKERRKAYRRWMRGDVTDGDSLLTDRSYKSAIDSLQEALISVKDNRATKRLTVLQGGFLDLVSVRIDSIDYTDSLSCKYYTHPNLGEQGLLCIYSTRSISEGEHTMHIERDVYDKNEADSLVTQSWDVPFWKYTDQR